MLLFFIFLSIVLIVLLTAKFKWHPFLALIVASIFLGIIAGLEFTSILDAIATGFGNLMAYIGIIVVMGSIIGVYLEKSGGAMTIAHKIVDLAGKSRSVSAMSLMGAIVSIPVFCDSGFILLSGLSKKLSSLSNASRASLSLALATGLYTTHTLVPPTPGPIATAGNIGASDHLGTVIILGICISIPVLLISQFLSKKLGEKIKLESEGSELSVSEEEINLPSFGRSMIPIIVPIVLISLGTVLKFAGISVDWIDFICSPLIAITIGAGVAMLLLPPVIKANHKSWLSEGVQVAGPILIITGAGGAFGGVLKATDLSSIVGTWIGSNPQSSFVMLILIFLIAAILKSAQGSSTNAMIITSSLLAPLISPLGWTDGVDLGLAVMAIGGGAMVVSHYNDSYFWVVTEFSEMESNKSIKSFTLITGVQGITVLIIVLLLSLFL
ncbi:MAG: GntP family permease [Saprospiraceae bacterium]|nr:GntP family permease [Saprospiraceae bacterium]